LSVYLLFSASKHQSQCDQLTNYLLDVRVWISLHQVPVRNLIVRGSLKQKQSSDTEETPVSAIDFQQPTPRTNITS